MFTKSIDRKGTYIDQNNLEVVDIGESFIDTNGQAPGLFGIYKVPADMEMRPDKISISAYGSDEYTEMVCVFNNIKNPFTIEEDDIVYMISLNNIYDNVYEPTSEVINKNKHNGYEVFRNFLDKSRLPKTVGSEKNTTSISKSTKYATTSTAKNLLSTGSILPPNVASSNASAIEIKDGKIIFGVNNDNYTSSINTVGNTISSNNTNNSLLTSKSTVKEKTDNKILSTLSDSILNANITTETDVSNIINNVYSETINETNQTSILGSGAFNHNGKVIFNSDASIGCATNAVPLGDYMVKKIKNDIK